jgi:hypothetical protein
VREETSVQTTIHSPLQRNRSVISVGRLLRCLDLFTECCLFASSLAITFEFADFQAVGAIEGETQHYDRYFRTLRAKLYSLTFRLEVWE